MNHVRMLRSLTLRPLQRASIWATHRGCIMPQLDSSGRIAVARRRPFSRDRQQADDDSRIHSSSPPAEAPEGTDFSTYIACGAMAGCVALSNFLVQFPVGYIGTWGTAVFPVCFLITDLTNRFSGAAAARKVVYAGFAVGVPASLLVLPDEPRIALASGTAFLTSQMLDVAIFDALRGHPIWWVPPLVSTVTSSALDSSLFNTIAFLGTDIPTEYWPVVGELPHWVTWGLGDFFVKSSFAVFNLLPFRVLSAKTRRAGSSPTWTSQSSQAAGLYGRAEKK